MRIKRNSVYILACSSIILFLSGCWDQVNIEDRGYVAGIAIDKFAGESSEHQEITMMNQFAIPSKLGTSEQSSTAEKPYTNLSVNGNTLFGIDQKVGTITARQPFYEHTKVIIFSEELAKEPGVFENLLDPLIRDHEMRRSTKVFISKDNASDVLGIEPDTDKIPALYIDSLTEGKRINLQLTVPANLGEIHSYLLNNDGFTIDHIIPLTDRIQVDGVSVFRGRDNLLVGSLNSDETKGMNLITRKNTGGMINFFVRDFLMVYLIDRTTRTIKIDVTDQENIKINIYIKTKGHIAEMFGSQSLLSDLYIEDIEKELNEAIEQLANKTIKKAQEELHVDFFGFSNKLRTNHYSVWEQIKDNWDRGDDLFSRSAITVHANSEISSVGLVDRAKDKRNE